MMGRVFVRDRHKLQVPGDRCRWKVQMEAQVKTEQREHDID